MLRIELVLLFGSLCATHAALAPAPAPAYGRTRAFAPAPGPAASKPFTAAQKVCAPSRCAEVFLSSRRCRVPDVCTTVQQAPPATPTLPCTSTQTALGGYSPVTDQEADSLSQDVAPAAWQAFTNKNGLTKCATSTVNTLSYNVTEACKQVGGACCMRVMLRDWCPHSVSPVPWCDAGGGGNKHCPSVLCLL